MSAGLDAEPSTIPCEKCDTIQSCLLYLGQHHIAIILMVTASGSEQFGSLVKSVKHVKLGGWNPIKMLCRVHDSAKNTIHENYFELKCKYAKL